jgi:hypothetical protein
VKFRTPSGDEDVPMEHLRSLAAQPVQHTLIQSTLTDSKMLGAMPMRIYCTDSAPGFITSDAPFVLVNPDLQATHFGRSPGLGQPGAEASLPLSPRKMIVWARSLNPDPDELYRDAEPPLVDELNRRTRWHCEKHFVVQRNVTKDYWFERGEPPADNTKKK